MNIEKLKEYTALDAKKADLEAALKQVNKDLLATGQAVIDSMADDGISKVTFEGREYKIKRILNVAKADGADKDDICEALKAAGYGHIVKQAEPTYNTNTLTALINEFDREASGEKTGGSSIEEIMESIPEPLRVVLKVSEFFMLAKGRSA